MEGQVCRTTEKYCVVREWSEKVQQENGDCLKEGYVSVLPNHVRLDLQQNDLSDLMDIWNQWSVEDKESFSQKYGDIALLMPVKVNEPLIQAAIQFWNPAYRCFTFNREDMTPTIEEYNALLRMESVIPVKIHTKVAKPRLKNDLASLTGMDIKWVEDQLVEIGNHKCIPWNALRELLQNDLDHDKRIDIFAFAVYGLMIFPKTLGHVEPAVVSLFRNLEHKINPSLTILAETILSLNCCKKNGEGRFTGCAQLLHIWIMSHFCKREKVLLRPYLKSLVSMSDFNKSEWSENSTVEQWFATFGNLRKEDVTWRAPWMQHSPVLYKCGNKNWVPLLVLWGGTSYAPLMVQRQFGFPQFIPVTHGLDQLEFSYGSEGYMRRSQEISAAWKQTFYVELIKHRDELTLDYEIWREQRVNDKITMPLDLQLELNFVRQQSELETAGLNEEIARLQEENRQVKGKRKRDTSKDDLGALQLENKKLHLTTEDTGLGKSIKDWEKEINDLKAEREFLKNKSMKEEEKAVRLSQEENEDLRALFEVEKETLLERTRDLECSVQGYKDRIDSLLMTLDEKDRELQNTLHVSEEACREKEKSINRLITQIRGVVRRVNDVSAAAEALRQEISQSGKHGQTLLIFLEEVKKQCDRVRCFCD